MSETQRASAIPRRRVLASEVRWSSCRDCTRVFLAYKRHPTYWPCTEIHDGQQKATQYRWHSHRAAWGRCPRCTYQLLYNAQVPHRLRLVRKRNLALLTEGHAL